MQDSGTRMASHRTRIGGTSNGFRPLLTSVLLGVLAGFAIAVANGGAQADPVPTNFTELSRGHSHYEGSLDANSTAWFKASGTSTDMWAVDATSVGALGILRWFVQVDNSTIVADGKFSSSLVGTPGLSHDEFSQVFLTGEPVFVSFQVWPMAANATDGLNYTLDFNITVVPFLNADEAVSGSVSVGDFAGTLTRSIIFGLWANASDLVAVSASVDSASLSPSGGPAISLLLVTAERPFASYSYPAQGILNFTGCTGVGCITAGKFVAPYTGRYFLQVFAATSPLDTTVSLYYTASPSTSLDGDDTFADAATLYHRTNVSGNLSLGVDAFDWFSINLSTGQRASFEMALDDPQVYGTTTPAWVAGALVLIYQLSFIRARDLVQVASETNLMPDPLISGYAQFTLDVNGGAISEAGTYYLRVSIVSGPYITGPSLDPASYATYRIAIQQPSLPPVAQPALAPEGIEDTPLTFDLGPFFADPEGDAMYYGISSLVPGAAMTVNGTLATIVPPPDFFGNLTLALMAVDTFDSAGYSSVDLVFRPVNDAPRVNFSALPIPLVWDQGNDSGNVSFAPIFYDVDGDLMTLSVSIPLQLTTQVCGAFCLRIAAVDPLFFGAGMIGLQASDPAGLSVNLSLNYTILHVNHAPALLAPGFAPVDLVAGGPGTTLEPGSFCVDYDGDAMRLEAVGLATAFLAEPTPAGGSDTGLRVSVPSVGDGGNWELQLRCVDSSGAGANFSLAARVAFPNRAPLFEGAQPIPSTLVAARENGSTVFLAFFLDPDGDVLAYAWSLDGILLGGEQGNATRVAFDFSAAGQHLLVLTARDPSGLNTSVSWTIEVADADRPPVCRIGPSEGLDGPAGSTLNLTSESFDPDGTALAYSWLRNGSRLSITGSAQLIRQPGTWLVELVVMSGGVSASCQVSVVGHLEASPPLSGSSEGTSGGLLVLLGLAAAAIAGVGMAVWALRKRKGAA